MRRTTTVINNRTTTNSIGVSGLLGVVFVVLKLTGVINWSWWWVTAPFWLGWAIVLSFLTVVATFLGAAFAVAALLDWLDKPRRRK